MIGYNPSHLNKNETLLEAFHRVEAYLKANPLYQVFQSSATYQEGTQEYTLNSIVVPEGSTVSAGDVVFFSNSYYAVIAAVYELTFSVETAVSFSGPQGPKGDKGDRGTGGAGSNPNLLINPNFAINQRGQTSYTGDLEYTVDRWKKSYGILELLTNGEIKHTSSNSWQGVAQYIENPSRLAGKTVTISAMGRGDGATAFRIYLYYQIGNNPRVTVCTAQTMATTNTIISASGTIPAEITDSDKLYIMLYNGTANTSFYCKWAKLEIGSVATEFSPPSIAEELQKCYRYYKKIMNLQKQDYAGLGIVYGDDSGARMIVENTFRANPTSTISGAFSVVVNGANKTVSAISTQSFNSTNIVVKFTLNSAVANGVCGYLLSNNSPTAYIAFDAEL